MKTKTTLKAGGLHLNHNETTIRDRSLRVKTSIQAGGLFDFVKGIGKK